MTHWRVTWANNRPVRLLGAIAAVAVWFAAGALASDEPPLELTEKIALKGPPGRLDHLALDRQRSRLFVANMANSSLDVVDLETGKLVRQVPDQKGIQGIAYAPDLDRIFVGNGEGGVCNVFDGGDYKLIKSFELADSDNVRYDARSRRVYVAHAENVLAVIDAATLEFRGDIKLPGSPEAFQLETGRPRLYLNTPSAGMLVAIDLDQNDVVRRYPLTQAAANYPLAIDESAHRVFVGCRRPPMLLVLDSESGKEVSTVSIPADIDDLFFDSRRKQLYGSCGEGYVVVIRQIDPDHYKLLTKIATAKGARTSLFDAATGRLFLVVPRQEGEPKDGPEIWKYSSAGW
ncbi:MAG: hypothetical protein HY000_29530 [Planctomycetes bacterium]|nr:hypothetical protein [Planctomycetota bacterium]